MIKNIVFDMGNVLLSYTPEEYMKTITRDETIAAAVLKELFYSNEWIELDGGTILEEDAVKQVINRIPKYSDFVQKAMDNWHSDLTPIQGMPEIVKKLKQKNYKIYLLSNTSLRFYKYKDKVDMFHYFDGFVISAKERLLKPDIAIYNCLCSRYRLINEECLFIDDSQENIDGAKRAGFHGHLFQGAQELSDYLKDKKILL